MVFMPLLESLFFVLPMSAWKSAREVLVLSFLLASSISASYTGFSSRHNILEKRDHVVLHMLKLVTQADISLNRILKCDSSSPSPGLDA